MYLALQIATVVLVSVAMALSLAHALELPGKLRLDEKTYTAMQTIYYPGFTIAGMSEPAGIIALLILLLATPSASAAFWWTFAAVVALAASHGAYWLVTHPVNKFWLKDQNLQGVGGGFFAFLSTRRAQATGDPHKAWMQARDRWEYSHVLRAVLSAAAYLSLLLAVVR
jgi:hypothetical protein